jgi:hypothetical protein
MEKVRTLPPFEDDGLNEYPPVRPGMAGGWT